MPREWKDRRTLRVIEDESVQGFGVFTAVGMLGQTKTGSEILQNGPLRAEVLIDLAAELNMLHPEHSDHLREVAAFGPYRMVTATSYDSIREALRLRLHRFVLQSMLAPKIGHVLTSEGENWRTAATISRQHTKPGHTHIAIAMRNIAATFDSFFPQLTSKEGVPATTLTIEMIHAIMTDTVFGGYHDTEVASWKDDIVYFLQHLIDVQQSYAVGLLAEKIYKNVPKMLQRSLMRTVARIQGVPDVLERMLQIEDELFPRILQWIEDQDAASMTDEQLSRMGFLGAALAAHRDGRPMDMTRADIFGIYTAALDSSANAANWLFSELAQNPDILRKVASLHGEERDIYIQYILFELWRKDPITPIIFRQVPAEGTENRTMPDGTTLPPNTIVLLSVGAAGRDPVRFPNPDEFNPDRYFMMTDEQRLQVKRDLELVFAAGDPHRCQGERAVGMTLTTLIQYMADHFERITIAPTETGEQAIPRSNDSGVCSPVDQYGKPLLLRVVPK